VADFQQTVDEVRFCLQSGACELTDELKEIAVKYGELCHGLNNRLRRCGEFLKQGLRAEAIQLAEEEPNLLDSIAVVDFAERREWDDVVNVYQLSKAEPLLLEVAEDLNEAYTLHRPLERLLERHRLLALFRDPVSQRLVVMRKLADLDGGSPFWDGDIRDFEKARQKEIEAEANRAAVSGDVVALYAAADELFSNEWRERPANSVVQSVRTFVMQMVADQLGAAYSAGSIERARELRTRWNKLISQNRAAPPRGVAAKIEPVLKWIAAEDSKSEISQAFDKELAGFERKLATSCTSREELERARHQLLKFGHDIPDQVSTLFHTRIGEINRASRNRQRRIAGIVLVAATVLIIAISILIRSSLREASARRIAQTAEQLVTQGRYESARQLLDENRHLSTTDPYLAVFLKLVEGEKKEAARVSDFQAALERARAASTPEEAAPALTEADRLALTNTERAIVDELHAKSKQSSQVRAADDESRFQQQLADANDLLDRLEDLHQKGARDPAFRDLLKIGEKNVAQLRRMAAGVEPKLAQHVDAAESRLARFHNELALIEKRTALLAQLTAEAFRGSDQADPEVQVRRFGDLLRIFAESCPVDPKVKDFTELAPDVDFWRGVVKWQQISGRWKVLVPRTLADVKLWIAECETWLAEFAQSPPAPVIREYVSLLRHVVAHEEDDSGDEKEGLRTKMLDLFSGPLIENVDVIDFKDGKRYYLKIPFDQSKHADKKEELISFRHIVGFRGEPRQKNAKVNEFKSLRSQESPQTKMSGRVRHDIKAATLIGWEKAGWDSTLLQIAELLRRDRELDPFLRYYMLSRTLEFAQAGNVFLNAELEPIVSKLHDERINLSTRWMDPDEASGTRMRRLADEKLNLVGDLKPVWDRARKRETEFRDQLFETSFPVGWLSLDERKRWQCNSNWVPHAEHGLWVVIRTPGAKTAKWSRIGTANPETGLSLRKDASQLLKEGRLVFAKAGNVGPVE
jgi:hypothetical protein